jgi:hypothetical protein
LPLTLSALCLARAHVQKWRRAVSLLPQQAGDCRVSSVISLLLNRDSFALHALCVDAASDGGKASPRLLIFRFDDAEGGASVSAASETDLI